MTQLKIELGPAGIRRVVVRHDADQPDQDLRFLDLAMPALVDINSRLRDRPTIDAAGPAAVGIHIDGSIKGGVFIPRGARVIASTSAEAAAVAAFLARLEVRDQGPGRRKAVRPG